jgi:5-methyltetrahydropteroyltriglutamate--homocysteine methyltransferase
MVDKIEYDGPITIQDQKYVKKLISNTQELIGVITGPYTLARSCVDLYYHDEQELAFDFASALNQEARLLEDYVDMISIDEPFFSNYMPDYSTDLITRLGDGVSCPVRLHVCGDVTEIVPALLDMPVDILSHEFKASPHLLDVFKEYNCSRKICLGCVRSDNTWVEPVEEITKHIEKGRMVFGDALVQLAPDCGQRVLPREVAFQKLQNLVKAGERVYG